MITVLSAALLGAVTWSFLEYCLHRWMGHDRRYRRTPFGQEHTRHHVEGNYFAPTWKKLVLAAAVAAVVGGPAYLAMGVGGGAWVGGLLLAYGVYEVLHRREHTHPGFSAYGRWARRHHFHHHFVDGRTNHGVTSPLWDLVFGTYRRPTTIPVPEKLAMAWLVDPATGAVRAEHAAVYELRAARR
jgi:sterol desaturase/sphingolipid hydroxylase (fatty acid hydroxylase superfamily)